MSLGERCCEDMGGDEVLSEPLMVGRRSGPEVAFRG